MSIDHNFYPENIRYLDDWVIKQGRFPELKPKSTVFLKTFIWVPSGIDAILSFEGLGEIAEMLLNGISLNFSNPTHSQTLDPYSLNIKLQSGWNEYSVKICNPSAENRSSSFKAIIIGEDGLNIPDSVTSSKVYNVKSKLKTKVQISEYKKELSLGKISDFKTFPEIKKQIKSGYSLRGFQKGTGGGENPSCGRFGFTKGDGILDCSMPHLGSITKPHTFGHPENKRLTQWSISLLPPGIDKAKIESHKNNYNTAAVENYSNDNISVNWLSVKWQTTFKTQESFYERAAGAYVNFKCTYSLGSPGIIIETDDKERCRAHVTCFM